MNPEEVSKQIKNDLKDAARNLKISTSGNPGQRLGYWLAGGAVVAAGAAIAFGAYRRRQKARNALNPGTVPYVNVEWYMGRWFEIARIPYKFEKNATDVQAFYTLEKSGKVRVENYCLRNGKTEVARGVARVADKTTNAKLKVSFFWPFEGDYWILALGENYEWALVGGPTGDYLWILSRTPFMEDGLRDRILALAREKGFDTDRLVFTLQEASHIGRVLEKQMDDGHATGRAQTAVNQAPDRAPKVLYPDIE